MMMMKRLMMLAAAAAVAAGTLALPAGTDALASGSGKGGGSGQGGGAGQGMQQHDRDRDRDRDHDRKREHYDERQEYKQQSPDQGRGGRTDAEIRQKLEAEGYTIQRMERERNEIEVKAMRGGQRWELKIDPETGKVLKREREN